MVRAEANVARKAQRMDINVIHEKPLTLVYEEKEEVKIQIAQLKATTHIASDLAPDLNEDLIKCMMKNSDVFA